MGFCLALVGWGLLLSAAWADPNVWPYDTPAPASQQTLITLAQNTDPHASPLGNFFQLLINSISSLVAANTGAINMAQYPGVDPTGATDSTVAVQAAAATGQNLFFPPGIYQWSNVTFSGDQTITCASTLNTTLAQNSTTGDFITLSGFFNSISGCNLTPIVRPTGYQVNFANSCYACSLSNFFISNAYNGIFAAAGNKEFITQGTIGSLFGPYAIEHAGTSGHVANNLTITRVGVNNAYPLPYGTVVTWTTNTGYTANQITNVNGAIYQESATSCTSASTGTGPSGFPTGTSPQSVFTGTIPDGTCTWRFVSGDLVGLDASSYTASIYAEDFTVLNNLEAVVLRDPANVTGSEPRFNHFLRLSGDHNFWAAFDAEGGFNTTLIDPYACSSLALNGIQTGGHFLGDLKVLGGRICDNWQNGIVIAAGSQITISGAAVGSNSQSGSGSFSNISIHRGIIQFTVTNNQVGKDLEAGNANAAYGIIVNSGPSDYYTVTGNICGGNVVTSCDFDGGSGSNKTVSGNF